MKKYMAGVLYYGPKDSEHEACMALLARHPRIVNVAEVKGCPYICIGRSTLAEYALRHEESEGLLFIDHDILFDLAQVDRILESCDETRGLVSAAYSMRSPGSKMIGAVDDMAEPDRPVVFFEGGGLYPAIYTGMGFTAIHRDAFTTIAERCKLEHLHNGVTNFPIRPYFSLLHRDGNYYGEDVSFGLRCKDAGVPMHIDTRLRVYHKGTYSYGLEDCGIVVPYLHQLRGIAADKPEAFASPVSPHPHIQRALALQGHASTEHNLHAGHASAAFHAEPSPGV